VNPDCPFYGVALAAAANWASLLKTGGNGCALVWPDRHAPCRMELEGESPDWSRCQRNPQVNGSYIPVVVK
jgi:hypothetical protein